MEGGSAGGLHRQRQGGNIFRSSDSLVQTLFLPILSNHSLSPRPSHISYIALGLIFIAYI